VLSTRGGEEAGGRLSGMGTGGRLSGMGTGDRLSGMGTGGRLSRMGTGGRLSGMGTGGPAVLRKFLSFSVVSLCAAARLLRFLNSSPVGCMDVCHLRSLYVL
jgi:hypothetical protein